MGGPMYGRGCKIQPRRAKRVRGVAKSSLGEPNAWEGLHNPASEGEICGRGCRIQPWRLIGCTGAGIPIAPALRQGLPGGSWRLEMCALCRYSDSPPVAPTLQQGLPGGSWRLEMRALCRYSDSPPVAPTLQQGLLGGWKGVPCATSCCSDGMSCDMTC